MSELDEFRAQKDAFFKTHPQSPLTPEQQQTFEGLRTVPHSKESPQNIGQEYVKQIMLNS
jgi:hypothetical protein